MNIDIMLGRRIQEQRRVGSGSKLFQGSENFSASWLQKLKAAAKDEFLAHQEQIA
jgi:hypothetical protein